MKKKALYIITAMLMLAFTFLEVNAQTVVYNVTPKKPYISNSIKGAVTKYKQQNYIGSMLDLEKVIEKEPRNTAAYYYLALCYTRLGYKQEAQSAYNKVIALNNDSTLTYYSKWATECLADTTGAACRKSINQVQSSGGGDEKVAQPNEMDLFIQSGKAIHPSAADRINKERLDRQLQEYEYQKKNQTTNNVSMNNAPTNEEIAQALNTLSKVGFNPFTLNQNQNVNQYSLLDLNNNMQFLNNNPVYNQMLMGNNNQEYTKMLLYNQLSNQMNYGI